MSTTENPHRRELEAWRDEYAKRRGLVRDMLYEAVTLVRDAVEWAERDADRKVALAEERAAGRVEQAQREADRQREECEGARRHAKTLQSMLDEKRALRDERKRDGEEVKVTVGRDYRGWWLSDLEEVAYRLRMGGAVDDTPIEVGEYWISANVPDPNMVSLANPERAKPELPPTTYESERPGPKRLTLRRWAWGITGGGFGALVTHLLLVVLR